MLPIDKTYLKTNLINWKNAILDPAYIIQKTSMPTASADNVNAVYQYIGETTATYTKGSFYQCQVVAGSSPAEYEWVEITTSKVLIDDETIKENTDGELYVPTATDTALGVISAGDGASVDANGELSIINRLKIANTVPEASEDNYEDIFLYIGTTNTTFTNGSFYKCTRSLSEGVWKYTWTEFGSNEKKILSFTSTSYYTLDKKSNSSMLISQISTYIRTYHTLPNIILVKSNQANCDIPVGTQIIYYLDPLTASCTDSSNFTCYYTGSGIYCPDENDTTTWRYFLFNDYANLITGATSTTYSNATEVSLLTYLKENTLEKVTELPTCTSKLIEERKCYLLTEEQTGYKKGIIYQALPGEIVMPATLETTSESYWNQYVTNGYLVKDGYKWYAAEGYVFSYAPQESGVDNLKVMDYIYYSGGDMASFYFIDGTIVQRAVVFSKGYYQFETIGWQPISGSALTFNNEDFDVVDNEVSLDASQKIKTFTQAEWDALSSAEKIALAGQNVIISDDEGTQTFEDIIPSNASASNKLATESDVDYFYQTSDVEGEYDANDFAVVGKITRYCVKSPVHGYQVDGTAWWGFYETVCFRGGGYGYQTFRTMLGIPAMAIRQLYNGSWGDWKKLVTDEIVPSDASASNKLVATNAIYKTLNRNWNEVGNRFIKLSNAYPAYGLRTNNYVVSCRNGETYLLLCGTTDGGYIVAPEVYLLYSGTGKLTTNGFYYDSTTNEIAFMTQGYNNVSVTQISGEVNYIILSEISETNPLSNPVAITPQKLVTDSDLAIKKKDISATGGATSFSTTIPFSMAQRNKPFYLEVLSVGNSNAIKEMKYRVFVSSISTSVTTQEISKDSNFTNVSITFDASTGYALSFSSTETLYTTTVYIQQ